MSPRKLTAETTLDDHEKEIDYTRAALAADPDAADLVPTTDTWLPKIDVAREKARASRRAEMGADAMRRVSNGRLDGRCAEFGAELALSAKPGTERWRLFFRNHTSVSRFVKQALSTQLGVVENWLETSGDATFEKHRDAITPWARAAREAITATTRAALPLGEWQLARGVLAEDMTRERDGLWSALDERRRERGLERGWPDLFFRVETSRSAPAEDAPKE